MSDISTDVLLEYLRIFHLLGLCAGIGGAIFADLLGLSLLFSRKRPELASVLGLVHGLVFGGLAVLWMTGIAIAVLKFDLQTLPPKVIAKVVLTLALTANAVLIRNWLLPLSQDRPVPLICHFNANEILLASFCGSLSFATWLSVLLIAKVSFLQQQSAAVLLFLATLFWFACFLGLLAMLAVGVFIHAVRRKGLAECIRALRRGDPLNEPFARQSMSNAGFGNPFVVVSSDAANDTQQNDTQQTAKHSERSEVGKPVRRSAPPPEPAQDTDDALEDLPPVEKAAHACRGPIAGAGAISLVTNLLMLTGPLFMLQVYDRVLTSKSVPTLTALMGLVAVMFVFMGLLETIRSRILVRIALRIDRILSEQVFASVTRITSASRTGAKTRLIQDLDQVRSFVSGPAPAALFDLPWVPIYFLVIFLFHWVLGVFAIVGAAVLVVLSVLNEKISRRPVSEAANQLARSTAVADAGRRNAEALHAMGMFNAYRQLWLKIHRGGLAKQTKAGDIAGTLSIATKSIRLFLQSFMLGAGAYYAILQEITPGVIIAVSIILARALAPIEQTISQWRMLIGARQGLSRIRDALSETPDQRDPIRLPDPGGHISVENLILGAPGSSDPILKGLNFSLDPGDVLAVVGSNSAGKSSLARALVGVWRPLRGQVRLDGAELQHWPPDQLGRNIGYLPQNVELFDGTVVANIARFSADADAAAVVSAARKAQVHDLILRLPDGYRTRIGEDGAVLSGGQRQRIALARAFYKEPVFIVLDEPNANLDPAGEKALFDTVMLAKQAGQTVVLITHKGNILKAANKILVLDDGHQVEFGPIDEVLRARTNNNPSKRRKANVHTLKTANAPQPA